MKAEISADELQNNIIICLNFGGKVTSMSLRHSGMIPSFYFFDFFFVISSASCKAEQLEFQLGTVEVK